EAGRKSPDRQAVLLDCHSAARDYLGELAGSLPVLAGRSMGGRMGTYLAAAQEPCRAVVLYAYPLHPPGKPDRLRIEHLPDIKVPMLFFQGTRDALSRMDLFDLHIRPLPTAVMRFLTAPRTLSIATRPRPYFWPSGPPPGSAVCRPLFPSPSSRLQCDLPFSARS
ncbi:MAG: alpha/beta family hydrolase, partial [Acidimicrobiia bacterium]